MLPQGMIRVGDNNEVNITKFKTLRKVWKCSVNGRNMSRRRVKGSSASYKAIGPRGVQAHSYIMLATKIQNGMLSSKLEKK